MASIFFRLFVVAALIATMFAKTHAQTIKRDATVTKALKSFVNMPDSLANSSAEKMDSMLVALEATGQYPLNQADILLEKGRKQQLSGQLDEAIRSLSQAYKLFDESKDDEGAIKVLINLGVIHITRNQPKVARDYLQNAVRIGKNTTDALNTRIYLNLGVTYDMEGRSKEAISLYLKTLEFANKTGDQEALATIYHSIGIAYAMMGRFDLSEPYEHKALQAGPSSKLRSQILGSLGSFYHEQNRKQKAEQFLTEAIAIAEANGYWDVLQTCRLSLSHLYADMAKFEPAYQQLLQHLTIKDSLDQQFFNQQLAKQESELKFDIQRKALELTELRAQSQSRWFGMLTVVSILLMLLALILYRNFRLKQKANRLLEAEKQLVELENKQLEEENLLLQKENLVARFETLRNQINPHFLFNALNSLYALIDIDHQRSKEFVHHFSQMYRLILAIQEQTTVPLKREMALIEHYAYLQKIRLGDSLEIISEIDPALLDYHVPPFAAQMLLENAIKHNVATANQPLQIYLKANQQDRKLMVSNQLQPKAQFEETATGTGLRNITNRYTLLSDQTPIIEKSEGFFKVSLPLLNPANESINR